MDWLLKYAILGFPESLMETMKSSKVIMNNKVSITSSRKWLNLQKSNQSPTSLKVRVRKERCQEEWAQNWYRLKSNKMSSLL